MTTLSSPRPHRSHHARLSTPSTGAGYVGLAAALVAVASGLLRAVIGQ